MQLQHFSCSITVTLFALTNLTFIAVLKNTRVKFNLYPGTSLGGGGGGASGSGGGGTAGGHDGHSREAMLLGMDHPIHRPPRT